MMAIKALEKKIVVCSYEELVLFLHSAQMM